MKEINMDEWERREHFRFFLNSDLPFYNVNFPVDITGLKDYTKSCGLSFNHAMIYLVTKTINRIENFLYRLINGTVVQCERVHPSFACLRDNEELFRIITVEFNEDIAAFDASAKEAVANSTSYFDLSLLKGRSDFIFISALPWIPFTGIDHTASLKKEDAIPRISWGKYYEQNGKVLLPFNIQVNHLFVDGVHVGRFYQFLHEEIQRQIKRN